MSLITDHVLHLVCGPLRLCPHHLPLHLLEQGGQQLSHWLECFVVALLSEVDIVKHVVMRYAAINLIIDKCKVMIIVAKIVNFAKILQA